MKMQIFETIREKLGWSKYKLALELGVTPSHYSYLSTKAKTVQTKILVRLQEISGISGAKFWELIQGEFKEKK